MNHEKTIECKLATLDFNDYPLIRLKIKKHNPDKSDAEDFIKKLFNGIKVRTDHYVILVDGSNAKWVRATSRDIIGTGMQHIESYFYDRHKINFLQAPNIVLWFLLKLFNRFIQSTIPQKIFFDINEAEESAKNFLRNLPKK